MQPAYLPATGLGLAVVFLLVLSCVPLKKRNFPPGPPRFPIIGNAHQLTSRLWVPMVDWRKIHGPLVYLTAFGQPLVILGTHKVTKDLLDRRAAIYSGRQRNIVAELMTSGYLFPFARSCHSKLYKRMRQAANEVVGVRVYRDYFPIQELESSIPISSILTSPNNFVEHLKRATGSAMISIIYGGPPVLDPNDPLILLVDSIGEGVNIAALPGSYFVEFFPWMMYLPRWMCPWRVEAENWYIQKSNDLKNLMQGVADREKLGTQMPCIASQLLRDLSESKINEEEAIWTAGTIYTGGVETTAGQMAWFIVAMVLNPSAQREAQIELDRVVGRDRLPSFNDLPQLLYTRAIVKEILRWRPIGPVGLPHRLEQDDSYEGYDLPEGSICVPNIWGLNHDPEVYGDDAHEFKPGRFLDEEGQLLDDVPGARVDTKHEGHVSFGFGTHACTGRHLANSTLFIQIASLLWAFDILPAVGETGVTLDVDANASEPRGIAAPPKPFKCRFLPRSEDIPEVVAQARARRI